MDELELLKKDWQKQGDNYPRVSYDQIYKMLWKKSSSIVKWIFVISIIEFLFWAVLSVFLADNEYWREMERLHLKEFTIISYVFSYGITFYFIYKFYKNYQKISATDDVSSLMKNILSTRRTVKYYIAFILLTSAVSFLVIAYFAIFNHAATASPVEDIATYTFSTLQWVIFIAVFAVILILFLGVIWLFYRLLYGILLKRLSKNYKELQKLKM
ncbi:hypothetical protein BH23BAC2_BH23BAC2_12960 [soil metagenome]